jgi:membrane protein YqaA with SNARE-associated domain
MNHLTAWAVTITAFSSGLYGIYKYILGKYYFSYDLKPIHYWSNRKQKIKKRYKTLRKYKAKKRNSYLAVINKYKLTNNKSNR